MKKGTTASKILALLLTAALFLAVLASCSAPKVVIAADVYQTLVDNGYEVQDIISEFDDESILRAYRVENEELYGDLYFDYFEFDSKDMAYEAFDENKYIILGKKGTSATTSSVDMKSWHKYSQKSDGNYFITIQVGTTVIFGNTTTDKDDVKALDDLLKAIKFM